MDAKFDVVSSTLWPNHELKLWLIWPGNVFSNFLILVKLSDFQSQLAVLTWRVTPGLVFCCCKPCCVLQGFTNVGYRRLFELFLSPQPSEYTLFFFLLTSTKYFHPHNCHSLLHLSYLESSHQTVTTCLALQSPINHSFSSNLMLGWLSVLIGNWTNSKVAGECWSASAAGKSCLFVSVKHHLI